MRTPIPKSRQNFDSDFELDLECGSNTSQDIRSGFRSRDSKLGFRVGISTQDFRTFTPACFRLAYTLFCRRLANLVAYGQISFLG